MRVLVLGGAGAVCREATRDLSQYSHFTEIIVADYDLEAAQALVESLADPRLQAVFFDADDYDSMIRFFPGFDVVLNGLPWKYDLPVTRACVEAGVNGLDVSTVEDQWGFSEAAREKGVVFIPGVGATPGITNVMARRGAEELDQVDEIEIYFAAFRCPAPSPGLLTTFLWEFHPETRERTFYRDGEFIYTGPFEGLKKVVFPGPIGEQEVCYIPHPETRTMPHSLGARAVSVRGCFPPHAMRLARAMLDSGLYSEKSIQINGHETNAYSLMHKILLAVDESKRTPLWAYGLVVHVSGLRAGRDIHVKLWNQHPPMEEWGGSAAYYKNIAIPLSIGAEMIARGDIGETGVVPPESAIDPEIFFAELRRRGILIHMEIQETCEL